jgi:hypothetical protein
MTRISSTVLVFLILMNGGVTVAEGSGLAEDWGVSLAPGVDDAMDSVIEEMKKGFSPDISVVESLLSMVTAGLNLFRVIIEGVFAAPQMFLNLGFPGWAVGPFFAPMYLISTLELLYVATQRALV